MDGKDVFENSKVDAEVRQSHSCDAIGPPVKNKAFFIYHGSTFDVRCNVKFCSIYCSDGVLIILAINFSSHFNMSAASLHTQTTSSEQNNS